MEKISTAIAGPGIYGSSCGIKTTATFNINKRQFAEIDYKTALISEKIIAG